MIAGALTLGALILRLSQLHQSLFGDEYWTYLDVVGRSLGSVLGTVHTGAENSPPLFFALAWASAKLGDPSIWIRLPSVLLGAATVPLVFLLGRDLVGDRAAVIGAAVMAIGPFALFYGTEARPYATMGFFVTLSTLALIRAARAGSRGWWLVYALAATAAAYSHYTAIFVLAVQWLWALWICRRRPIAPLVAGAACVLLYLPWLPYVRGKALPVIGALEPLTLKNVLTDLPRPLLGYPYASLRQIPTVAGLAIVLAVCALGLVLLIREHRARPATDGAGDTRAQTTLLVALAVATPVGLLLYSVAFTDLWLPRGLYASLPFQALLVGVVLARLRGAVGLVATAAVLATLAIGSVRSIGPAFSRPPLRAAAAYLDRVAGRGDPVILYPSLFEVVITVQFERPHLILGSQGDPWSRTPRGGSAFAILDAAAAAAFGIRVPDPPGFSLVSRRRYTGLLTFTVLGYRRTG